jgi:hypothetical protein
MLKLIEGSVASFFPKEMDAMFIGTPQRIGGAMSYAGLFETGEGPLKAFRAAAGIEHSVLAPGARELAFA